MLSFVRRLNPFRRQSEVVPPQNVTRAVQTDINGSFPLGNSCSQTIFDDTVEKKFSRKGINKLLQVFEKENLNVATLMDQEGRIFFTIDLTEVIFKDAELENIVKMVQKTMREPSHGHLSNNSDEISKKLKRHFLFESMKRLSESHHSNTPDKNNVIGVHPMESIPREFNAGACGYNKSSISAHETELKSLLYEVKASLIPEENDELLEDLKSSLATKIFKKIEQTIDSIKRKHNYNQEIGSNANISIVFSRNCNPVEQKRRNISYKNQNPDKKPQTRHQTFQEQLQNRREIIKNKLENKAMEKKYEQSDSSDEKTREGTVKHRNKFDAENRRKNAVETVRRLMAPSSERPTTPPTRDHSRHKNSEHSIVKTEHKTQHVNKNEPTTVEKNRKDKKNHLRKPKYKTEDQRKKYTREETGRKYSPKTHIQQSKDRFDRETLENKTRRETKHTPKEKRKDKVEHRRQDNENFKEKPTRHDETKKARPVTHHTRYGKFKSKTGKDDRYMKRKENGDGPFKSEEKLDKVDKSRDEKSVEHVVESEHVVVLFNSNRRGDDKSKRRKSQSEKKDAKLIRPIRERFAFTSSDNSQIHRGIMNTNTLVNLKPRDIPPGSSEKLIALISFGPPQ